MYSGVGPTQRVLLTLRHRSNEDWYLELPVELPEGQTLAGAQARCLLKRGASTILFDGESCRIESNSIILELPSTAFTGKSGLFQGDILVKFPGDIDIVTHVITADIEIGGTPTW